MAAKLQSLAAAIVLEQGDQCPEECSDSGCRPMQIDCSAHRDEARVTAAIHIRKRMQYVQ
jgi:hypothetical protein